MSLSSTRQASSDTFLPASRSVPLIVLVLDSKGSPPRTITFLHRRPCRYHEHGKLSEHVRH
ncbi:hypothetical protein BU26DRAFT_145109 [Trematosphaeria pertusa]|uniref:Uncharacterized protein n=1 Tax=Trematosphaeria pertusa TaxID=390896 RepID=A0A6A6IXW5_9PLEO|nr:uncharacterized protein BU26DRAFT_145109 [Trematosphaeria pertusa]KAF2254772.1 hypothetical protein BU26DRAFT_145109 [Trematosphaeria pertusa]